MQYLVKLKDTYILSIAKLQEGEQDFKFSLGDDFFKKFEHALLQKGNFEVILHVTKSDTMLQLDFDINGEAELTCDRSLEPFTEHLDSTQRLILKFGAERELINETMEIIPWQVMEIDLSQYLYEFISLALPMKKLHPKFRNTAESDSDEDENATLVYSSQTEEAQINQEQDTQIRDPRWEALKKLKNN